MKIKDESHIVLGLLIVFALTIRIIAVYLYGDTVLEYEWQILLNNLYNNGVLSLHSFNEKFIPSAFMPPLYVFFLYILKLATPENIQFTNIVLTAQIILSTLSILIFYKLNNFFFNKKWSLFNSLLLSIFPLNIYTTTQISSISLQVFLLILFFYLFFSLSKSRNLVLFQLFFFSLVSGFLMLLRGEFYLVFLASLGCLLIFKKIDIKKSIIIFLVSLIIISPYLVRNYLTFNKIVLTQSVGFNLLKGNNSLASVEGSLSYIAHLNDNIYQKSITKNNLFEIRIDELFFKEGVNYIKEEPIIFIKQYFKKFLTFFYFNFDSTYPNYYHPLFIIPVILTSLFSTIGIFLVLRKMDFEKGYVLFHLFFTIFIFSFFFILPRYKMIILPMQLILMNYFFMEFVKKILKKNE